MTLQLIGIGTNPNDGTGATLRAAGSIANQNFAELYNSIGAGGVASPPAAGTVLQGLGGTPATAAFTATPNLTGINVSGGNLGIGIAIPTQLLHLASSGALAWDNGSGTADTLLSRASAGVFKFGSANSFSANGSVATALTSVGPTGSHTTVQTWLTIVDSGGTTRYIPCF
jgi:hypothetical protein